MINGSIFSPEAESREQLCDYQQLRERHDGDDRGYEPGRKPGASTPPDPLPFAWVTSRRDCCQHRQPSVILDVECILNRETFAALKRKHKTGSHSQSYHSSQSNEQKAAGII